MYNPYGAGQPTQLTDDPFATSGPAEPSPFAQALAMARLNISEATLARQNAAAVDTHESKKIDLANKTTDFVAHQLIRDSINKFPDLVQQRQTLIEQTTGRPMTEIEATKFKADQYKTFSSVLDGNKSFDTDRIKLAIQQGNFQDQLKQLQKNTPGAFRNAAGVAGSLIGGVVSSLADTASGILTLAGVDSKNAALQVTEGVSKGASALGTAAGTKEQQQAQEAFNKAIEEGDLTKMINTTLAAPGFILGHIAGGVIGPAGVAMTGVKLASRLETLAKFSTALGRISRDGNAVQKIAASIATNVPIALAFGAAGAGTGASDAEAELLKQKPDATAEQINQARLAAAKFSGGINAVGTVLFPGLENATGKVVGAFGKKTGDALAVGLEEAAVKQGFIKSTLGALPSIAGEGVSQAIQGGLTAGAGTYGASEVTGAVRTPEQQFVKGPALLGGILGVGGKAIGKAAEGVGNSRQASADQQARGQADTLRVAADEAQQRAIAEQTANDTQASTDVKAQQEAQGRADVQASADVQAQRDTVAATGRSAADSFLATTLSKPADIAALRRGDLKLDDSNTQYKEAVQKAIEAAYPDPAARTPETEAIVKTAFDQKVVEAARPVVSSPAEEATKTKDIADAAKAVSGVNDAITKEAAKDPSAAKGSVYEPLREETAKALTELHKNSADLSAIEVKTAASGIVEKIKTETAKIATDRAVADANRAPIEPAPGAPPTATREGGLPSIPEAPSPRAGRAPEALKPVVDSPEVTRVKNIIGKLPDASIDKLNTLRDELKSIPKPAEGAALTDYYAATRIIGARAEELARAPNVSEINAIINRPDKTIYDVARVEKMRAKLKGEGRDTAALDQRITQFTEDVKRNSALLRAGRASEALKPAVDSPEVMKVKAIADELPNANIDRVNSLNAELRNIPKESDAFKSTDFYGAERLIKERTAELEHLAKERADESARAPKISEINAIIGRANKTIYDVARVEKMRAKLKGEGPDTAALDQRITQFTEDVQRSSALPAEGVPPGKKDQVPVEAPVQSLTSPELLAEVTRLEPSLKVAEAPSTNSAESSSRPQTPALDASKATPLPSELTRVASELRFEKDPVFNPDGATPLTRELNDVARSLDHLAKDKVADATSATGVAIDPAKITTVATEVADSGKVHGLVSKDC